MKIDLFSADIKLVDTDKPGNQSFRVLEFNDGLQSGFSGYDALGGDKMVTGRIMADYRTLLPDHYIMNLIEGHPAAANGKPVTMLARGNDTINWLGRPQLVQASLMSGHSNMVSSDIHLKALCQNKAYQHFMADQAGMGDLFPRAAVLPTSFSDAKDEITVFKDQIQGDLVLKPVQECGGTGIRLISTDKSVLSQLKRNLSWARLLVWPGLRDPICVLEERIKPNEVKKDGQLFDGTMRVVFSIAGSAENRECLIHDAYWKLPSHTMGDGTGVQDFVSYSPSNRERRKEKKTQSTLKEDYKTLLGIYLGDMSDDDTAETSSENINALAVAPEVKDWLFPAFGGAMAKYFSHVAGVAFKDNVSTLVANKSPSLQGLGWMLATHYDYYPAAGNKPSMQYPADLRDAMAASSMVQSPDSYMYHHIKDRLGRMDNVSIHCENIGRDFIRPLEKAQKESRSGLITNALFDIVMRLQR